MTTGEVIVVDNLSKAYPVYEKPWDMVRELIGGGCRHNLFWALSGISFSVREKQRVGIIGPNGSGKSTLLKILTGNLPPTSGTVRIDGKISAMLTLATAINPEETGLNNIRFNLMINGCPKSAIEKLTEDIIDFAELGPFIYAPVKTYSAGMNARLAFTLATAIEPEILIIDEVLGAGDAYFIGKANKRIVELCNRGRALVFVSHNLSSVQMLCDTVIWLDNGSIRSMGRVDHVLKQYEEDYRRREDEATRSGNMARKREGAQGASALEMAGRDVHRLRLVSLHDARILKDTHYVRNLTLTVDDGPAQRIELAILDVNRSDVPACLDVLGSEWGRLYSKHGSECRLLCSQSGKGHGGHILVKRWRRERGPSQFSLSFETCSILGHERLGVEALNYRSGQWEPPARVSREPLADGWERVTAELSVPEVDDEQYQRTLEKLKQEGRPTVEIETVTVVANERPAPVIRERQPFEVRVRVRANRRAERVDVGVKVMRSDGVYVFWQSSGITNENLRDFEKSATVCFLFNENCLSAGEYFVSAYCANGWDLAHNYPYSEVFDRKVNAASFRVEREFPILDFGLLNTRVPVVYLQDGGAHASE